MASWERHTRRPFQITIFLHNVSWELALQELHCSGYGVVSCAALLEIEVRQTFFTHLQRHKLRQHSMIMCAVNGCSKFCKNMVRWWFLSTLRPKQWLFLIVLWCFVFPNSAILFIDTTREGWNELHASSKFCSRNPAHFCIAFPYCKRRSLSVGNNFWKSWILYWAFIESFHTHLTPAICGDTTHLDFRQHCLWQ